MVRKIVWTEEAIIERQKIFDYWNERNQSKIYSAKLFQAFNNSLSIAKTNPKIGRKTDNPLIRYIVVRDYLIFYKISPKALIVISIWDGRRNPEDLKI